MKKMRAALLAVVLTGCATNPDQLSAVADVETYTFQENYQEIYRRVSSQARMCLSASLGAYASNQIDAQLYPDLGYGEVTYRLSNFGVNNYYFLVKIEKKGDGTLVTSQAGNTLAPGTYMKLVRQWAHGDKACTA